jgi:copper chaperone CopZ
MGTNTRHGPRRPRGRLISSVALIAVGLLAATPQTTAQEPASGKKQAVVTVKGMQCPFCAYGIKKHLGKLPGATRVDVDLRKNQATVTFEADTEVTDEDIEEAIGKAGFTPGEITWQSEDPKKTGDRRSTAAKVPHQ